MNLEGGCSIYEKVLFPEQPEDQWHGLHEQQLVALTENEAQLQVLFELLQAIKI